MPRPDYTLYNKGVRAAKAEKSKMRQASFEKYAAERAGYYEAAARGEIQPGEDGKIPAFRQMPDLLG